MGNHKDFATGTVLTAPSPATTGLSLVLNSGEGARQPTDFPFYVTAHPDGEYPTLDNAEKLKVTGVSTDTLTIERAQGDTTAKSIATGWRISNAIFTEDVENTTHVPNETPAGTINGTNDVFTTAAGYAPGSLKVFLNGVRQREGASNDYEETATGFTMNTAPETDDVLLVDYQITDATWEKGANVGVSGEVPTGAVDSVNDDYTTALSYIEGTLEVYINGVYQKPTTDYTETTPSSGTFAMVIAPTTGDEILVRYDHVLSVGGSAQTVDGNSAAALLNRQNHTGYPKATCAFYAQMSADQNIANSVELIAEFDTEVYDVGGDYDPATYTFTAPVNGIYSFSASLRFSTIDDARFGQVILETSNTAIGDAGQLIGFVESVVANDFIYPQIKVSMKLDAGHTVKVKALHNNGTTESIDTSDDFAWFMGELIGTV